MKQLSRITLSVSAAIMLAACNGTTASTPETDITGAYSIYVEGDDFGPGVSRAIVSLNAPIDGITAEDISVSETKQAIDWSDPEYPLIEATSERTINDIWLSDAEGNKTEEPSSYFTIEMNIDPVEGSPVYYSPSDSFNHWCDPYQLEIKLKDVSAVTTDGTPLTAFSITTDYTEMTTEAEPLLLSSYTAEDGMTYAYGEWDAEDSNALVVWLHGSGEGGTEATDPHLTSLGNEVTSLISEEFQDTVNGASVLVPECPTYWMDEDGDGGEWKDGLLVPTEDCHYTESLQELIESRAEELQADKVVLLGASSGGYMAWQLMLDYPDYYAASVLIAANMPSDMISDEELESIKDVPLYFVYSENDDSVPPATVEEPTIERLNALGASDVHVSKTEKVVDLSERFNYLNDGKPYEYNGHWSWIYFDKNETSCTDEGLTGWDFIAQAIQ